jgi:hypothetical protein
VSSVWAAGQAGREKAFGDGDDEKRLNCVLSLLPCHGCLMMGIWMVKGKPGSVVSRPFEVGE